MTGDAIKTNPQRGPRRGHGRVTLDDVGRAAGVTSITVSRFLREPHKVASVTAARIEAALASCGYVPNKQAGVLASGAAPVAWGMVAALIPSIANSIFAETIQGLSDGLQGAGHELLLAPTGYSLEREEAQLRAVLGWFPSALVVTGRHHSHGTLMLLEHARERGTPVIEMWDRHAPRAGHPAFTQVGFDHRQVGRAMAQHFLERGYRRLGYVDSGVAEDFRARERGDGYAAAARAAGATMRRLTAPAGDAFDAGRQTLGALLGAAPSESVDAAAFANDHLACGALLEATQRGIELPAALALLGFGDFPIGRQLRPRLSTVQPPRYQIGAETARLVVAGLRGGAAPRALELGCTLVARDSA